MLDACRSSRRVARLDKAAACTLELGSEGAASAVIHVCASARVRMHGGERAACYAGCMLVSLRKALHAWLVWLRRPSSGATLATREGRDRARARAMGQRESNRRQTIVWCGRMRTFRWLSAHLVQMARGRPLDSSHINFILPPFH